MKNVQKKMMDDGCNGLKEWRNDMHTWWRFIQHTEILFNFIACNPIYLFLLNVLYTLWHTHTHTHKMKTNTIIWTTQHTSNAYFNKTKIITFNCKYIYEFFDIV